MRTRALSMVVLAVGTLVVSLGVSPSPATAAQSANGTFTTGSYVEIHVNGPPFEPFELDSPSEGCAPSGQPAATLDPDLDAPTNGAVSVDAPAAYDFGVHDFYSIARVAVEGVDDTIGTMTTSASGFIDLGLSLRFTFYDCDGTTELCRTQPVEMDIGGIYNGGTPGSRLPGSVTSIGGTSFYGIAVMIGCHPLIRYNILNRVVTMDGGLTLV